MSFQQRLVFAGGVSGATVAYAAPLAAYKGSVIALSGITGTASASSAGLVFAPGAIDVEADSFCALVETDITTSALVVKTKFQGSPDGINWVDIPGIGGAVQLAVAASGTGSLVTTQYFHPLTGVNLFCRYIRLAANVTTGTGAAGDNLTVSYCLRKRLPTAA